MHNSQPIDHVKSVVEQAANLFMEIQVSIGTWKASKKADTALAKAAHDANVKGDYGRLYVDMLGSYQSNLKAVVAKYTEIRTYLYAHTEPTAPKGGEIQAKGDRLVPTAMVPEVLANLQTLVGNAHAARDDFLASYDQMVESVKTQHELGDWIGEIEFPSMAEVRAKFHATVSPPMPLQLVDAKDINLPAELAGKIAEASIQSMHSKLSNAKDAAFEAAGKRMEAIAKSLTGGRCNDAQVREAKYYGEFITSLGQGLGDPRITAIGEEIASGVANVSNADQWRNNEGKKQEAAKTAAKVAKDIAKIAAIPAAPTPAPSKDDSGLLIELW